MEKITTTWEVWTYDVWGNATDGYDVNDRACIERNLELELTPEVYNAGTPHEFVAAYPSDEQIRGAFGVSGKTKIDIDGDDVTVYVGRERDGYPIGEMICTSHESLSPIRKRES